MVGSGRQRCLNFDTVFPVLCLSLAIAGAAAASVPTVDLTRAQFLPITAKARLGGRVVQLEVARTPQAQALGLMFRPALSDERGMWFPGDRPQPVQFWMKNVPVSLDMLFLREGKIVAIAAMVPPCTADPCPTYPKEPVWADAVLELRGGWAAAANVRVGDRVEIEPTSPCGLGGEGNGSQSHEKLRPKIARWTS
jgi:uncharacterized membrane protein (UPF0127 family)